MADMIQVMLSAVGDVSKKSKTYILNSSSMEVSADNTFSILAPDPIDGVSAFSVLHATVVAAAAKTDDILVCCRNLSYNDGTWINTLTGGAQRWTNTNLLAVVRTADTNTKLTTYESDIGAYMRMNAVSAFSKFELEFFTTDGVKLALADITKFSIVLKLFF